MTRLLFSISFISLLSACAVIDEGAVDYRVANIHEGLSAPSPKPKQDNKPEYQCETLYKKCKQSQLHNLVYQADVPPDAKARQIKKGEAISIRLRRAMIADFLEIMPSFPKSEPDGEIAIVFRAFELGKDENSDFSFGPSSETKGRLVFYSPNVYKKQILNFNNMPVYGPIEYTGRPLGLDISIIEIDSNSAQSKALMEALAGYGEKAFAPAEPLLKVFNNLGKSILSASGNDTIFRFSMLLDPHEGYKGLSHPRVEVGDYVFIREHDRQSPLDFDKVQLNSNDGLLYRKHCTPSSSETCLYRENTYLTLQINTGFSSKDIDLAQDTYANFLDELKTQDEQKAESLTGFVSAMKEAGLKRQQIINFDNLRIKLARFETTVSSSNTAEQQEAKGHLYDIVKAVYIAYKDKDDEKKVESINTEQIDFLIKGLRSIAEDNGKLTSLEQIQVFDIDELSKETMLENAQKSVYRIFNSGSSDQSQVN